MQPPRPVGRGLHGSLARFLENPASMRYATMAIVTITTFIVLVGAVALRVFDREEYSTFGNALWFSLQTVTTVGYGDNTPEKPVGRVVASVIMLTSVGLITIVTAIITSTFVAAARAHAEAGADTDKAAADKAAADEATAEGLSGVHVSLDAIADRLERLEARLAGQVPGDGDPVGRAADPD